VYLGWGFRLGGAFACEIRYHRCCFIFGPWVSSAGLDTLRVGILPRRLVAILGPS
jgi:hypothetical protein